MGKGAGQELSPDTDEHEHPGRCAGPSGQVASSNMRRRGWVTKQNCLWTVGIDESTRKLRPVQKIN
jgi:hypothetical protein